MEDLDRLTQTKMENTQQANNIYYNYILLDPRKPSKWVYRGIEFNFLPFYVGKGSKSRVTDHYRDSCDDNLYTKHKIKKLKDGGFIPTYTIFNENVSKQQAFDCEIETIKYIKDTFGNILTNLTDGGEDPPVHIGKDNVNAVHVCQYDKDTGEFIAEWDSAADACRSLGISTEMARHITQCCKGTRRTAAMYKWSFEKLDKIDSNQGKFDRIKFSKLIGYNDNEIHEFRTMKEAYDFLGEKNKGRINSVLKGDRMTYKGYYWKIEK